MGFISRVFKYTSNVNERFKRFSLDIVDENMFIKYDQLWYQVSIIAISLNIYIYIWIHDLRSSRALYLVLDSWIYQNCIGFYK